jgi:hypothetical protein
VILSGEDGYSCFKYGVKGPVECELVKKFVKLLVRVIGVIRSRILKWKEHVARMGRGEMHKRFQWGYLREGDHLEDQGVGKG